jgi:hypothetical protein
VALRRHPHPGLQAPHQLKLDVGLVKLAVAVLPADLRLMVPTPLTPRVRPKPRQVHAELARDPADYVLGHAGGTPETDATGDD